MPEFPNCLLRNTATAKWAVRAAFLLLHFLWLLLFRPVDLQSSSRPQALMTVVALARADRQNRSFQARQCRNDSRLMWDDDRWLWASRGGGGVVLGEGGRLCLWRAGGVDSAASTVRWE